MQTQSGFRGSRFEFEVKGNAHYRISVFRLTYSRTFQHGEERAGIFWNLEESQRISENFREKLKRNERISNTYFALEMKMLEQGAG